jgi:hypothetical protein
MKTAAGDVNAGNRGVLLSVANRKGKGGHLVMLELVRVLLLDLCLVLALVITFRFPLQLTSVVIALRTGLVLILVEDIARIWIGFAISLAERQSYPTIDLVRSWASAVGVAGTFVVSVSLFLVLSSRRKVT